MPPTNRTVQVGGIWAESAPTPPASPSYGNTYANTSISEADIQAGWPFSVVVDSADFNEVMRRVSQLLTLIEGWGILPWSPLTTYDTGARVMGSNGALYLCVLGTTGNDPVSSPTYWQIEDITAHAALTNPHGAVSTGTADRLVLRDSAGRAQVTSPIVANDIARKMEVDGVQGNLNTHAALSISHNAVSAATGNRLMVRDSAGRSQVAAPSVGADIARLDTVTTHAALTGAHGAVSSPTVSTIMRRDGSGRSQVAAPSAAADIARLDTVSGAVAVHAAVRSGAHGLYVGAISKLGGWVTQPAGWMVTRSSAGRYWIIHNLGVDPGSYVVQVQPQPASGVDPMSFVASVPRSEMTEDAFYVRTSYDSGGTTYVQADCEFMFSFVRVA